MYGLRDFLRREGLGHVVGGPQADRRRRVGNARIAGHQDDRHVGFCFAGLRGRSPSMSGILMSRRMAHSRRARPGSSPGRHRCTFPPRSLDGENAAAALANRFLVVNNQNRWFTGHEFFSFLPGVASRPIHSIAVRTWQGGCKTRAKRKSPYSISGPQSALSLYECRRCLRGRKAIVGWIGPLETGKRHQTATRRAPILMYAAVIHCMGPTSGRTSASGRADSSAGCRSPRRRG